MQNSLVALECLRKSSEKRVLTRVYRQLYNLDFYKQSSNGKEIVAALKEEKYRNLNKSQLRDLKEALKMILKAVFEAEFSENDILKILREHNHPAIGYEELPNRMISRIDDGRFWNLFKFFDPWRVYLKKDELLIWDTAIYNFNVDDTGRIQKIYLDGLGLWWSMGQIFLDRSFKAQLLRSYHRAGRPIHRGDLLNLPEKKIIELYTLEENRFRKILSCLSEPSKDADILYVLKQSLLKTLACKFRTSTKDVKVRFELFEAD